MKTFPLVTSIAVALLTLTACGQQSSGGNTSNSQSGNSQNANDGPAVKALRTMLTAEKMDSRLSDTVTIQFDNPSSLPKGAANLVNSTNTNVNGEVARLNRNGQIQYTFLGSATVTVGYTNKNANISEYATTNDDKSFKLWVLDPTKNVWATREGTITLGKHDVPPAFFFLNLANYIKGGFSQDDSGNFVNHTTLDPNNPPDIVPEMLDTGSFTTFYQYTGPADYELTTKLSSSMFGTTISDMTLNITIPVQLRNSKATGKLFVHIEEQPQIDPGLQFKIPDGVNPKQ